jgi:peptidoglycan-associated lipoprotein
MVTRGKTLVRLMMVLLLIGGVTTNCAWMKRMRRTPRQHWWEFWKPKAPKTDLYSIPGDLDIGGPPPAPPVLGADTGTEDTGIPVGPPPGETLITDVAPEPDPIRTEPAGMVDQLQMVFFEFDSAHLTPDARRILDQNAEFLRAQPGVRVLIEGHCDERGTQEYNLHLGERRAEAARQYLISKNVPADQLHTISWGEERPLVAGSGEQAWSRNRRVQFQVY